jgi:tRNA(Ile)-lysidine synthetase-like protein
MIIEAVGQLVHESPGFRNGAGGQLTAQQISALEGLLDANKSGKRVEVARGVTAWREFDQLVLLKRVTRESGSGSDPSPRGQVGECSSANQAEVGEFGPLNAVVDFGGLQIAIDRRGDNTLLAEAMSEANTSRERGRDWMIAILDEDALPQRLLVRARLAGERVIVKGRTRTKRLKSLMIDHRIPPSRRASWPVVTTPDDRYVWSPGLPPAEEFAVRDRTRLVAILRASIL